MAHSKSIPQNHSDIYDSRWNHDLMIIVNYVYYVSLRSPSSYIIYILLLLLYYIILYVTLFMFNST